jgi:transglutaminase-like putative cysteine protease
MGDREKWTYLSAVAMRDAEHPGIVRLASLCLELGAGDRRRALVLAHAVAGRGIRYRLDTDRVGAEDVAGFTRPARGDDPLDAWRRGVDDCDAKARLFVALALALGFRARLAAIWRQGVLAHVFAEVDRGSGWESVETTLARAVIGEAPTDVSKEGNGTWLET